MIIEFNCEVCGTHRRVYRAKGKAVPRYCSVACRGEAQRRQPLPVTREWLNQKYTVERLGCPEIGKLVNRDGSTVRSWLLECGIPTRPRGHDERQHFKKGVQTRKGTKLTEEAKRKVGEASRRRGAVPYLRDGKHWLKTAPKEANPSWKGGITPERQAFYRSPEWKKAVRTVWYRDKATCRRCGLKRDDMPQYKGRFHIHHVVTFTNEELRADPDNLVLLCNDCHYFVHSSENVDREFLAAELEVLA